MIRTLAVSAVAVCLIAAPCAAQTPSARCEADARARASAWEASSHASFANDWETETREIALAWCRMRASSGREKVERAEDLQALLFTGPGLHPEVGTITPDNGIAVGAQLGHISVRPARALRFESTVESRASLNGSWTADATIDAIRTAGRTSPHAHAWLDVDYAHLVRLSYFGPGNDSAVDETRFGLNKAAARITVESAAIQGFSVFGQVEGLHAAPLAFTGSGAPSIEARFTDAVAPALATATTYLVVGGGATWRYPREERTAGYSSGASARVRRYQEAGGRPYSFTRTDLTWSNQYAAPAAFNFGTISAVARMTASAAPEGHRVPFYLQPTLGGMDINSDGSLQSFRDYRFRQPDVFATELVYTRTVIEPVDLRVFYDVGKVGSSISELRPTGLRHSYGAGITVRASDLIYVQAYVAWGGEGTHTIIGGSTNSIVPDAATRGFF
jgi:hypothetical protein